MKRALIIFVRSPELGKVKTRLAAQIGDAAALHIYLRLLQRTRQVTFGVTCKKYVFSTDIIDDKVWIGYNKEKQADGDLGQKMSEAFRLVFNKGFEQVIIIGSDCPDLCAEDIELAFDNLTRHDVVIGPAKDGGYYLLGMKKVHPDIFINKSWSTAQVFEKTIETIKEQNLSYHQLKALSDVDELDDVPLEWRHEF